MKRSQPLFNKCFKNLCGKYKMMRPIRCNVSLCIPRCPGRGRGECGRGSVGDVVVKIKLFLLLVRQLLRRERETQRDGERESERRGGGGVHVKKIILAT